MFIKPQQHEGFKHKLYIILLGSGQKKQYSHENKQRYLIN